MNKHHQELLNEIKKWSKGKTKGERDARYMGTKHIQYDLSVPQKREIAKRWAKKNKNVYPSDFIELLNSLNNGRSSDEKGFQGKLLSLFPNLKSQIQPKLLDSWLENLEGWGEVDSLCQNVFSADAMLKDWNAWETTLKKFSVNKNAHKRRASLVLLTGPVHYSTDKRFADVAVKNIEKLKHEKDILITKAISWLLRSMITNHKKVVAEYLAANSDTLPKIAVRETQTKLATGRKNKKIIT